MSTKEEADAELIRIWGSDYGKNLSAARGIFNTLGEQSQALIDQNSVSHIQALADMASEAYQNPRHPDHQRVSQNVQNVFNELHADEQIIF